MKRFSTLSFFSASALFLLCVLLFFPSKPSFSADPESLSAGVQAVTKTFGAVTNAHVCAFTNSSVTARSISQINLYYTGSDSSTVTVSIANSTYGKVTWFSITNSTTTMKCFIPDATYWILPGDYCVISNSPLTANTNTMKIMYLETK